MDINPLGVFIFPGNILLFIACCFFGLFTALLIYVITRILKKRVSKWILWIPFTVSIACLLLWDVTRIKTAMWRQSRGFDVGFGETQIAPLGNGYSLITSSEFPLDGEIRYSGKPINPNNDPVNPLRHIRGLQTNERYIWGMALYVTSLGELGYFILDKQSHQEKYFKNNAKDTYKTQLAIQSIGEEGFLPPYEFYLDRVKKLNQPSMFSLELWLN